MGNLGLLVGLGLLIWLALRGVNIVLASILCSVVVLVTNGLSVAQGLTDWYPFGALGAFTFAGKFFLLFVSGAMFGRAMGDSHAAASIASALVRAWGAHRALWIITIACALLTYGGVVVFVVVFAMYPLGLRLLQEANIPKRLFCGALALGSGTFTLTALPGTPSVHNVISASALGTDLFAGAWLGLFGGSIMFVLGMWYLERERLRAGAAGERFVPGPRDRIADASASGDAEPRWAVAAIPPAVVLLTILVPRLVALALPVGDVGGSAGELLRFAAAQPIVWPSFALVLGSLVAVGLLPVLRRQALRSLGEGAQEAVMPLINTAAVIGFGGVVTQTAGFGQFSRLVVESSLPPLLSMFGAVSVVSAITGSASGGLQIFMATMAKDYVAMGIDPAVVHRLATMASGGLDSLPHCGAVVALLTITGLTHREAYRDVGVVTVIVPIIATLLAIAAAMVAAALAP